MLLKMEIIVMKLKKDLVLRKVAGENIVVPIGRLSQISPMMEITDSTAWLWNIMKNDEFTEDSLVEAVMGHFSGVSEEIARKDIQAFLKLLDNNYMLDNGRPLPATGSVKIELSQEEIKKLEKDSKK